jgi:hypothetical protein
MKTILHTFTILAGLGFAVACSDEEPEAEESSGGENAFDTAERNANEAQQNFQREIKPAADFVDEKTNTAVDEGKKAAGKVGDAVSGDDEDDEPEPGKP